METENKTKLGYHTYVGLPLALYQFQDSSISSQVCSNLKLSVCSSA